LFLPAVAGLHEAFFYALLVNEFLNALADARITQQG